MRIAYCNGGLGNQVFQYIFSRYIEIQTGETVYLDDSFFYTMPQHNGLEMFNVFPNAKAHLLSDVFSEDVWKYILENRTQPQNICQQLKDSGEDIMLIAETENFSFNGNTVFVPTNQFFPAMSVTRGNIYYHGYWLNKDWLLPEVKQELQFVEIDDERNKRYEEQIEQSNSVALHIRRGDFVSLGYDAKVDSYALAVRELKKRLSELKFFIFSDDLKWCHDDIDAMGLKADEVVFVEGNTGVSSFRDMQLMSYCKNACLVSTSSFSYLAYVLNRNDTVGVLNMTSRVV